MFSASKRLSKDKLNGPEGVPLVGTYDLIFEKYGG